MDVVRRVGAIMFTPDEEWTVIAREPGHPSYLFREYVALLAAIPAICGFVGTLFVGAAPGALRGSLLTALLAAAFSYVLTFVVVYVLAVVVDLLAPKFGGRKDFTNALKLTVYSHTPAWLAGFFLMIPGLRFLALLGLYGVYLFWRGLPPLMRSPPAKTLPYVGTIVACAFAISLLIGAIRAALFAVPGIV
jgi:hypothetical protein